MKKNFRFDIAILRLIAITIVVFFHAYGMTYANHFPERIAAMYREKYELFNQSYLINIAMPLFTVISGFLFGGQLLKRKYQSLSNIVLDKGRRLLIPYFVFTVIFMFATNNVSLEPLYRWNYWHLWYLPMLFWCFIASFLLREIIYSNKWGGVLLICLFLLSLCEPMMPRIMMLYGVPKWLCWFVAGIMLNCYEDGIFDTIKKYHLIWPIVTLYFCTGILLYTEYGDSTFGGQTASLAAVITLWYCFRSVRWEKLRITNVFLLLSSCSFGIYIFHNWVEVYMISSTAQRLFPLAELAESHIYLFPFVFSMLAFIISFFLTWLLRKNRIGRFLLG